MIEYLKKFIEDTVTILLPELMSPLVVRMNNYAALVGPNNPILYKKLIESSGENGYKIKVREITEDDLK